MPPTKFGRGAPGEVEELLNSTFNLRSSDDRVLQSLDYIEWNVPPPSPTSVAKPMEVRRHRRSSGFSGQAGHGGRCSTERAQRVRPSATSDGGRSLFHLGSTFVGDIKPLGNQSSSRSRIQSLNLSGLKLLSLAGLPSATRGTCTHKFPQGGRNAKYHF